jgi:hypothetical protein
MTVQLPRSAPGARPGADRGRDASRSTGRPASPPGERERTGVEASRWAPGPCLVLVIGGHAEQGDDGAPLAAAATLLPTLPAAIGARLEIRRRPLLDLDDLAAVPRSEHCLLIDAASGPPAGMVLTGGLDELRDSGHGELGFLLRSARHESIERLLDAAAALRGAPVEGRFVALTGHRWGFGTGLSPAVRDALPAFRDAIEAAIRRLAAGSEAG